MEDDRKVSVKIHVCCGRKVLDGWTNVDVVASPKAPHPPEILASALEIPLPDGCADEIMCIHGFEHLYRWEAPKALIEWHRLLKPSGLLVLEMPDGRKCAKNLLRLAETEDLKSLDALAMWGLYGSPLEEDPFMTHRWAWWPKSLRKLLKEHGFGDFKEPETQWHPIGRRLRDFRIEARKRASA